MKVAVLLPVALFIAATTFASPSSDLLKNCVGGVRTSSTAVGRVCFPDAESVPLSQAKYETKREAIHRQAAKSANVSEFARPMVEGLTGDINFQAILDEQLEDSTTKLKKNGISVTGEVGTELQVRIRGQMLAMRDVDPFFKIEKDDKIYFDDEAVKLRIEEKAKRLGIAPDDLRDILEIQMIKGDFQADLAEVQDDSSADFFSNCATGQTVTMSGKIFVCGT